MSEPRLSLPPFVVVLSIALASLVAACAAEVPEDPGSEESTSGLAGKQHVYERIRDTARAHGVHNTAFLLAGLAEHESKLAMCWSEATWGCQGPPSPDCGGGPVLAGSGDGACAYEQGGLGMFQFDAGTYWDTIATYGDDVLTIDGQVGHAVSYIVDMVRRSRFTTNAETDEKALAWINAFDIHDDTMRSQWIDTVLEYYNGCLCGRERYHLYEDALWAAYSDAGGPEFWSAGDGGGGDGGGGDGGGGDVQWVRTWKDAPGRNGPNPTETQVGTLVAGGPHYVECKFTNGNESERVSGEYGTNNKWLWMELDSPAGTWGWVSAYYLTGGGNGDDTALDLDGREIVDCPPDWFE